MLIPWVRRMNTTVRCKARRRSATPVRSYARGDWGVGSDLVAIVERSDLPFERRASSWDVTGLPVPAELLVYRAEEWDGILGQGRFRETLRRETVWVYDRFSPAQPSPAQPEGSPPRPPAWG